MTRFDRFLRHRIFTIACAFTLIASSSLSAAAQGSSSDKAVSAVKDAAQKGFKLPNTNSTDVTGNVSVEATLIPPGIAKTVFSKEVANNYAVIELTVSNRGSDSFIVHTIFIDYSQWLLSGSSPREQDNMLCPEGAQHKTADASYGKPSVTEKKADDAPSQQQPPPHDCIGNRLQSWQQQTRGNQINSVETRIVRDEVLNTQPWTTRNWVLRALQTAGSIATGFTFVTSNQSWIHGIGAFNGSVVPGLQTFWPDPTNTQMNLISDLGFKVNKVISKQSSDIIVAFFPIDRFLTPDLKSVFLSSPAAFFTPLAALIDPRTKDKLQPYVDYVFNKDVNDKDEPAQLSNLKKFLPMMVGADACSAQKGSDIKVDPKNVSAPPQPSTLEDACQTANLLNRLSLNTVRVVVGGTMTVDVDKVPPQITSVEITPADKETTETMWTKKGTLSGTIFGSFLGGGTPGVSGVPASELTIKRVEEGSNDTELHFTLTLASPLPEGTNKLTFQVSKTASAGSTVKSSTYDYAIQGTQTNNNSPQAVRGGNSPPASSSEPVTPEKPAPEVKKPEARK